MIEDKAKIRSSIENFPDENEPQEVSEAAFGQKCESSWLVRGVAVSSYHVS